jgi:hypothetical protein
VNSCLLEVSNTPAVLPTSQPTNSSSNLSSPQNNFGWTGMYCKRCQQFQNEIAILINHANLPGEEEDTSTSLITWPTHEITLYEQIDDLKTAARSRCYVCRCILGCLEPEELRGIHQLKCVTVLLLAQSKERPLLRARFEYREPGSAPSIHLDRLVAQYAPHLSSSSSELWQTLDTCSRLDSDSTGSPASFELAKYWIHNCMQNHADCPKLSSGWLPKRVVDVGPSDGSAIPRLIETDDQSFDCTHEDRKFVSLSHCWGSKQIITTTTGNIDNHKRGICPNELSRTFQDAVRVTRSLGERYLWIDSLCIIQDSMQDWKTQSVQMCSIYQRAAFTIMAAHAGGGDDGCFVSRDSLAPFPFRLQFKNKDQKIIATACFLPEGRRVEFSPGRLQLFSRAWVLQEQMISRARLIYSGDKIHWQCQSVTGSERTPEDKTVQFGMSDSSLQISLFALKGLNDNSTFMGSSYQRWYRLIEDYTQRRITKTSDRLIAVEGLAQAVQERTAVPYLAGLWREHLPLGLMWFIPWHTPRHPLGWREVCNPPSTSSSSRHEKNLAPTWSWGSVKCSVKWLFSGELVAIWRELRLLCEVIQAEVHGTPFEQTGTITIQGMTRTLYIDPYYQEAHFTGSAAKPILDGVDLTKTLASKVCRASTKQPFTQQQFTMFPMQFRPDEVLDYSQPVKFLALGEIPAHPRDAGGVEFSRPTVIALALQATGKKPNEYRRIGLAQFYNCSWFGYFCFGQRYKPDQWHYLNSMRRVDGWRPFLKELINVCCIWIRRNLLMQPIIYRPRLGWTYYRELAVGKWGRHAHGEEATSMKAYRKGWEPKNETITII